MQAQLKNDLLCLLHILEAVETIAIYAMDFNEPVEFFTANHGREYNASLLLLIQVGEQAGKISAVLKKKYQHVNWNEMKSFRNRAVHDYTGLDRFMTFEIIKQKVPDLKALISAIVYHELLCENFDAAEFTIARTSPYLSHVDFDFIANQER